MAFNPILAFVSQDRSGRILTIRDATGAGQDGYSPTGIPRSQVLGQIFTFSRLDSDEIYQVSYDDNTFTDGRNIAIRTADFTDIPNAASYIFNDGILDVNMYVEVSGMSGVTITAGTNFITGGDFTSALEKDSVVVNDKVYQINKSDNINTNNNTVLYIVGLFEDSATSFTSAYRANTKMALTSVSKNIISLATRNVLTQSPDQQTMYRSRLLTAIAFHQAGIYYFEDGDYVSANELLTAAAKTVDKLSMVC